MKLPPLQPSRGLAAMVASPTFQKLSPIELVVYMRLLSMSGGRDEPIHPINRDLYVDPTTALRALNGLEAYGLISIVRGARARKVSHVGREITVMR